MTQFVLRFSILVLTFLIGVFANSLVNRAAYNYIPDVDTQPTVHYVHVHHCRG